MLIFLCLVGYFTAGFIVVLIMWVNDTNYGRKELSFQCGGILLLIWLFWPAVGAVTLECYSGDILDWMFRRLPFINRK